MKDRILVVDDDPAVCKLISGWLENEGYKVIVASDGQEALNKMHLKPDLVISDMDMPNVTGLELLKEVSKLPFPPAFIIITAIDEHWSGVTALEAGALAYIIKPFKKNEILIQATNALRVRKLEQMRLNYQRQLETDIQRKTREIRDREKHLTQRLVLATELNDISAFHHIKRIGLLAGQVARYSGWNSEDAEKLELAASMHDIGKVGVPREIVEKPGRYNKEDFNAMKQHCEIGAGILSGTDIPLMNMAVEIALNHHEKWDGSGYPNKKAGTQIPLAARITAIADVFDALLSNRAYRTAFTINETMQIIIDAKGTHFDPELTEIFIANSSELIELREIFQKQEIERKQFSNLQLGKTQN